MASSNVSLLVLATVILALIFKSVTGQNSFSLSDRGNQFPLSSFNLESKEVLGSFKTKYYSPSTFVISNFL